MPAKPPAGAPERAPAEAREPFAAGEAPSLEDLALTFERVGSDEFEGAGERVRAFWHRSPYGAELVLWRDLSGGLLQAQLDVRGEVVQWNKSQGLRTGLVVEAESAPGATAEEVRFDAMAVPESLARAQAVAAQMESLEPSERQEVAKAFRASSAAAPAAVPAAASAAFVAFARAWLARLFRRF